jgi:hypothetical protein
MPEGSTPHRIKYQRIPASRTNSEIATPDADGYLTSNERDGDVPDRL